MSEESSNEMPKLVDEILEKTFKSGQLVIIATKQHGKTNACMWLVRRVMQSQSHAEGTVKSLLFDTVLNFRYKFDRIPYLDISKVRHIKPVQDLIVDLPYMDSNLVKARITQILMEDFHKKRTLKEKHIGVNPYQNLYVVEEMQNVWGTYGIKGQQGRFALKVFSEGANYGIIIWGLAQRCASVSTEALERSQHYLIGRLSGDNDIKKIARVTTKKVAEEIKTLKRGQFIFWDRDNPEYVEQIDFPLFKSNGTPYELTNGPSEKWHVKRIFIGTE